MSAMKNPSLEEDYLLPEKEGKSNLTAADEVVESKSPESSDAPVELSEVVSAAEDTLAEVTTEERSEENTEDGKKVIYAGDLKLETAPFDYRFPATNQTRHCFTRYIEYHRCVAAKGEDAGECDKFARWYRSLCPNEWVENWNEQRANGTFPGPL